MSLVDNSYTNSERLHNARQFKRVFSQADKSSNDIFTILFRENTIGYPRLGIVVAKRNVKRSVDRNIIKRIIRESFRMCKTKLPPNDYVVILKRPIRAVKREKLRKKIDFLWQ